MLQLTEKRIKKGAFFHYGIISKTEIEEKEFIIYTIRQMLLGSTSQGG
jgi:hypothetical protein